MMLSDMHLLSQAWYRSNVFNTQHYSSENNNLHRKTREGERNWIYCTKVTNLGSYDT